MLTVQEAEPAIIREFDRWATGAGPYGYTDGMEFFNHLRQNRPDLLEFKYRHDKWQRVHGWLLSNRRVSQ